MALYAEMQQRGLRPDSYTLTALLTACERVDKWDQATRLFDELTAAGVQPDVRNYNSLIYTLGKGGQWAQVCTTASLRFAPERAESAAKGLHLRIQWGSWKQNRVIKKCGAAGGGSAALQNISSMHGCGPMREAHMCGKGSHSHSRTAGY